MALRLSSGLRNFLNEGGSLKQAFAGGKLLLYSGSQPTTADDAVAGTLLCTYTLSSGAHTAETKATGVLTISGTTSGSIDTCTLMGIDILGGAVTHTGNNNTTADAVAAKINHCSSNQLVDASTTGASAVITLTARPGFGTTLNSGALTFTATTTTATVTSTTMGSGTGGSVAGVASANGLKFGNSSAGVLVKHPDQTWSGTAGNTGTAGWFRLVGAVADAGSADAAELYLRLDGNVATSGANLNLSSTTITSGATQTISTFSLTEPAA